MRSMMGACAGAVQPNSMYIMHENDKNDDDATNAKKKMQNFCFASIFYFSLHPPWVVCKSPEIDDDEQKKFHVYFVFMFQFVFLCFASANVGLQRQWHWWQNNAGPGEYFVLLLRCMVQRLVVAV